MSEFRRRVMMTKIGGGSIPDYLCFTALEDGTFTFTYASVIKPNGGKYVEYSLNGRNWNRLNSVNWQTSSITTPTIKAGKQVYWRGDNLVLGMTNGLSKFSSTGKFDVSGNLASLTGLDNFDYTVTGNRGYGGLFEGAKVVNAKDMVMPKYSSTSTFMRLFKGCTYLVSTPVCTLTNITGQCCVEMFSNCTALTKCSISLEDFTPDYAGCDSMFAGCSSLTESPLKGGHYTVPSQAFKSMFLNCSSLVTCEDIYIDALVNSGLQHCSQMFEGCTSLKRCPVRSFPNITVQYCYARMFVKCKFDNWDIYLPAAVLTSNCQAQMFRDSNITYIKMLATDISAGNCLNSWLNGAPNTSSCIFVKHIDATWTDTGVSGVPSGWTVIYYDPALDKYYTDQTRSQECDDHGNPI